MRWPQCEWMKMAASSIRLSGLRLIDRCCRDAQLRHVSSFECLDEVPQLIGADVADREERETPRTPVLDVEPLHRRAFRALRGGRSLRDEEIDHVRATSVDDRGDGPAVDIVKPPA